MKSIIRNIIEEKQEEFDFPVDFSYFRYAYSWDWEPIIEGLASHVSGRYHPTIVKFLVYLGQKNNNFRKKPRYGLVQMGISDDSVWLGVSQKRWVGYETKMFKCVSIIDFHFNQNIVYIRDSVSEHIKIGIVGEYNTTSNAQMYLLEETQFQLEKRRVQDITDIKLL